MWAIVLKEFRQLRRDRRTLAMLIVMPLILLVIFGYAASFDVAHIRIAFVGRDADRVASLIGRPPFVITDIDSAAGRDEAIRILRDNVADVAVVADGAPQVLVDGSQLFTAKAVVSALKGVPSVAAPQVLFNPDLKTSVVMVPALIGIILVFVGTLATSLGVVRERQAGTLEQLAVMPFRARDVFVGKVAPYFVVACVDMGIVVAAGLSLFHVPFRGSPLTFALGALLFLFVTLGLGVLISTVSENQGQAIQLAIMTLLPQVLLSGLIFPLSSMAAGVRWISYVLPLTYFIQVSRGVMIKGTPITALGFQLAMLALLGLVVFGLSVVRFRKDLATSGSGRRHARHEDASAAAVTPA